VELDEVTPVGDGLCARLQGVLQRVVTAGASAVSGHQSHG
ncbi:MAG: hypothetical protein JWR83_1159, partial [Aeromicrobium sp.]|nr:hypothetical protein [Aeromicrobium sp.]